ncbi:hypothetical protein KAH81_04650 [bacterium]|nr:hypothetical protein [bacterium]
MDKKSQQQVDIKEATDKVSPEEYQKFINQLKLETIFLSSIKFNKVADAHLRDLRGATIDLPKPQGSFINSKDPQRAFATLTYNATIVDSDEELLEAEIAYTAEFSYETTQFDIYNFTLFFEFSLLNILHPYFRRTLDQLISESYMGHFIMPLLKTVFEKSEDND